MTLTGLLEKAGDVLGLGLLFGTLYVLMKYGKGAAEGIQELGSGIGAGISSALSPRITPTLLPSVGLNILGLGGRGEDRTNGNGNGGYTQPLPFVPPFRIIRDEDRKTYPTGDVIVGSTLKPILPTPETGLRESDRGGAYLL